MRESIINKTNRSVDTRGLLKHMARVRTTSQKLLTEIVQSRDEYQTNESSNSRKFDQYKMFCEHRELTTEMVDEMAEKILIDSDGVRVI